MARAGNIRGVTAISISRIMVLGYTGYKDNPQCMSMH